MKKMDRNVPLGVRARDLVTGFEGVVTARASFLTGCDQYCLNPGRDKEGKLMDSQYFDVNRLEVIDDEPVDVGQLESGPQPARERGGPQADMPRGA